MTIDANIIEGFKIGLATGLIAGAVGMFFLMGIAMYAIVRKGRKDAEIRRPLG